LDDFLFSCGMGRTQLKILFQNDGRFLTFIGSTAWRIMESKSNTIQISQFLYALYHLFRIDNSTIPLPKK
jgi:hypothetical protein